MKSIPLLFLIILIISAHSPFLICQKRIISLIKINSFTQKKNPSSRKRPKHKPKPQTNQNDPDQDDDTSHPYHPNPVVLAGVSQIMNSALNIAQDPHSRPNVGHSIANIVHGIATIIIEKLARKKLCIRDWQILQEWYQEIYSDIDREIFKCMEI